jgi:UDP-N-acetylglucosamine--N-acetylmuramyl-(pentapeptide) pyrophosphoryl-undecaprenol N-acetylglucosamine transferase
MANKKLHIIIAGGGTGGHIFPAIAIANELKRQVPNVEILFVGATGKMEMEKVPQAGYNIKGITIAGFNRSSLLKNIGLPFKLIKSFFEVSKIIKEFKPQAVIGVGGYSSFPVLRYAQTKGIATFIHESNSFAGKANIMLGKKATAIFTATAGMQQFFSEHKTIVTGNPVRKTIATSTVSKEEACGFFKLDVSKKTVLVVGGSLGAKSINKAVENGLDVFANNNLQLIWQTGKPYFEQAKRAVNNAAHIYVSDFVREMENAYAAADVVISRSGAMAMAELCIVGKPVIFVPYPFAAEDHQTANAMALVNKNAALVVKDAEAKVKLIPMLEALCNNVTQQQELKNNIQQFAIKNADEVIVNNILKRITV